MSNCGRIFLGRFVHVLSIDKIEFVPDGYCIVSKEGIIEAFGQGDYDCSQKPEYLKIEMQSNEFMIPGFIDTHTHAPQYRNAGIGMQYELLEWLDKVTFPQESWFYKNDNESSESFQSRVTAHYSQMVQEYLRNGTTTCCYFGSIQNEANLVLAKVAFEKGQRAFIGKVCMDCNSPAFYVESTEDALHGTMEFVNQVQSLDSGHGLVAPIITPRFAITCSRELMKSLGDYAASSGLPIQSHLAENKGEVEFVGELFPESPNYTAVYDRFGLLRPNTIMAHCIYLSEDELELIRSRQTSISHCPNSNFALSSGIMSLVKYLQKGLKVGLGTDVSGGYSLSILDAMRQAIIASKCLVLQDPSCSALTVEQAFYLATLGGASALSLSHKTGNFVPGKCFDALVVELDKSLPTETLNSTFERFVFCGSISNIKSIYVNGKLVLDQTVS